MNFLTSLLASIIRPIIQEELNDLKAWVIQNMAQADKFKEYDEIVERHINLIEQATTPEEVKAHVRRLYADRAKLK